MLRRVRLLRGLGAVPLVLLLVAGPAAAADVPPPQELDVVTALPPGESGSFGVTDVATGTYGPHVDDQRELYWDGRYKDGAFHAEGPAETPRDGVRVHRDAYGVPAVYGDTGYDVWWGAGWAAGQDRLFLADAVRRMGRGTFAELVGPSGVPLDVQTRTLTYSQSDYDAMYAALPQSSRDAIAGYAAGLDAWIAHVRATPSDLPAEYALLSTLPERWTVTDTLAAGVLITRTVAASGGTEPAEVEALRELQQQLGADAGLGAFEDLHWLEDDDATVTVPDARFDDARVPAAQREQVYRDSAAYALALPPGLAQGPGTGAYPAPGPADLPAAVRTSVAQAVDGLLSWGRGLHGGSYAFAVSGSRTSTGKPMLVSGPQLGYSYPTELWELEVHGAGYDARGATVPGLPTVGIGYGKRVAWGLTTGYSKTIDSFVETTRRVDGRLEALHDGAWVPADCRTETVRYREAVQGVPAGPPALSVDVEVCRTVHGPVVSQVGDLARSVQYAMYGHELETVNGILQWNRAQTLAEFEQGVRMVTWNENVTYADADGHIAFWHPGRYPVRSTSWDSRFPAPGTGEHDPTGLVPFDQMPHSVDPAVGYLANWNNKPAHGWLDEYQDASAGRPAGRATRVSTIQSLLAAQPRLTPEGLRATEFRLGTVDQRVPEFLPLLLSLSGGDAREQAAVALLRAWDGTAYGPGAGTSSDSYDDPVTDGPAPTVFRRFMDALRDEVLADLPDDLVLASDSVVTHRFDATPADNVVLRALVPSSSALPLRTDLLHGRTPTAVVRAALTTTLDALQAQYGADPASWRDEHPRSSVESLTGVVGPSRTMPFEDRGSWVHVVAFRGAAGTPTTPTAPPTGTPTGTPPTGAPTPVAQELPRTGGAVPPAVLGLALLLGAAVLVRRRGVRRG